MVWTDLTGNLNLEASILLLFLLQGLSVTEVMAGYELACKKALEILPGEFCLIFEACDYSVYL